MENIIVYTILVLLIFIILIIVILTSIYFYYKNKFTKSIKENKPLFKVPFTANDIKFNKNNNLSVSDPYSVYKLTLPLIMVLANNEILYNTKTELLIPKNVNIIGRLSNNYGYVINVDNLTENWNYFVVLRGTITYTDLVTDITIPQQRVEYTDKHKSIYYGNAHGGFVSLAYKLYDEVNEIINEHSARHSYNTKNAHNSRFANSSDISVLFSGHSMGASVAEILSVLFSNKYKTYSHVSARPNTGDEEYNESVIRFNISNNILINYVDVIPTLPFVTSNNSSYLPYSYYFDREDNCKIFFVNKQKGSIENNHDPKTYLEQINLQSIEQHID